MPLYSHPEALVLPTTRHSLAIWTPINSIDLNQGELGQYSSRGTGAKYNPSALCPGGQPHLIRVAWQVCGQLLGLHVPHLQCAVTAAADQQPAVG